MMIKMMNNGVLRLWLKACKKLIPMNDTQNKNDIMVAEVESVSVNGFY